MDNDKDIFKDHLKKHAKRVIKFRRDLHKIPESGFEEYKTSRYIAQALKKMNIPFRDGIAKTGIIATVEGKGRGPVVLLRADIDGIDVPNEQTGLPFRSQHDGMMHACGHDTHTAMLLCAGSILFKVRNKLNGNVILVFQPAEEGKGGGRELVRSGAIDFSKVDVAISQHIWGSIPAGTLGYVEGPAFAQPDKFIATIKGKGGHGCNPHLTRDPITAAAQVINAVNTIVSRKTAASEKAVISFGSIQGGAVYNVIPDEVTIKGTIRTYKSSVRNRIKKELKNAVIQTARGAGADASLKYSAGYPVVHNNSEGWQKRIRSGQC